MLSSCSFNESALRSNYEIDVKLGKFGPFLKYVRSVFSLQLRFYFTWNQIIKPYQNVLLNDEAYNIQICWFLMENSNQKIFGSVDVKIIPDLQFLNKIPLVHF